MRATIRGALVGLLLVKPVAAGFPPPPPDPHRSIVVIGGQVAPCQFRFDPIGALDTLQVIVTARNMWDDPMDACSTTVALEALGAETVWCHCCPDRQVEISDGAGASEFQFSRIGGRGGLSVHVTVRLWDGTPYWIGTDKIEFTSRDLDGSCDPSPGAVTVIDLGLWASCLPPGPYCRQSDFNCDSTVDVIDLGAWAGGLGTGCDGSCP